MKLIKLGRGPNESSGRLQVCLCHSSGDKDIVRQYCLRLNSDGFMPWVDEESMFPGQDWEMAIRRAVRESHAVVVFLSASSITKEGYVQKEIRLVLDAADEKPENTIFVIPARLELCEVPERLRGWQRVDLFDHRGYERMTAALRRREAQLRKHSDIKPSHAASSSHEGDRPLSGPPLSGEGSGEIGRTPWNWSRSDKIGLMASAIAILGLPGVYLAVPGVVEYVHNKISTPHIAGRILRDQSTALPKQSESQPTAERNHLTITVPGKPKSARIFVHTTIFPARLYLDGSEVTTLTQAVPSTTLDTSPGSHKVSVRSHSFRRDTTVTLAPGSPPQVLFIDKDQNVRANNLKY